MDGLTIVILAVAGVLSVLLFVVKGLLDQLPDVFESAKRAREAWKRLVGKSEDEEVPQQDEVMEEAPQAQQEPPEPQDEEPPAAA
ncbi:hypothetical protein [Streptomyces sp. UG1]|uniref:hypothetical protein n=1 Tax=Streptomyces sp. UG1 TaxID=3417652 RepID=UPI003CF507B2